MTFPMIALLQAGYYAEPHAARYDAEARKLEAALAEIAAAVKEPGRRG